MRRWLARFLLGNSVEELYFARYVHRQLRVAHELRSLRRKADTLAELAKTGIETPEEMRAKKDRLWLEIHALAFEEENGNLLKELFG